MAIKRFYGIKYPFKADNSEGSYVDLNTTIKDRVRSYIMHVIFTPKGQKLRDPEFGTDLIRYIFEQSDSLTFEGVKNDISTVLTKYVPNCTLKDINVIQNEENPNEIYVRVDYEIKNGYMVESDSIAIKL